MGVLDWLFGREKRSKQSKPGAPLCHIAEAAIDDEDDDAAEATTFFSRRLSPNAQREIKNLRDFLAKSIQDYAWHGDGCKSCKNFLTSGWFRVGDGLIGQAPVPGREGRASEKCDCELVPGGA